MCFIQHFERLVRMDAHINRKGTGDAHQFARRLNVSRRTIYADLDILRQFGAVIEYNIERESYFYVNDQRPNLPVIAKQDTKKIRGGESFFHFFSRVQNYCTGSTHLCNKLTNEDEQNDAGGFERGKVGD
jgi:hypothetical protein